MRHRKHKKLRRRIELLLKTGLVFCMMTFILPNLFSPSGHVLSENIASESSDTNANEKLISMEGLSQDGIPTGCEAVSTVALLQHLGIDISIEEFINTFLPCQSFYRQDGLLYGPDPNEYFAGNPYESSSLGCYPDVILKALRAMKYTGYPGMENLNFKNVSGTDLDTLVELYIDQDLPVLLWVSIDMKEPYEGMKYYLADGSLYTWTAQEHCTVLCGYDNTNYYLMDPLKGGEIVGYSRKLVETRYDQMQRNAVVVF